MIKVNVGLSRKLSKDYNSTGFSLNIEGEITAPLDNPEMVVERIREFYDLAEEALDQQIERHQGDDAIANRDTNNRFTGRNGASSRTDRPQPTTNGNGSRDSQDQPATNKQINYLLSIAKLEARIAEVLGRPIALYDLTKRAAGTVIDALNGNTETATNGHRRD
jgi:hypothetical protein